MISHHMSDEYLVDYAAGSLPEAESLIVASHLSMCAECRQQVETFETLGAVMLEDSEGEVLAEDTLDAVFSRIDAPDAGEDVGRIEFDRATQELIPPPLRDYLNSDLEQLKWKSLGWGIEEAVLKRDADLKIWLLRIRAAGKIPHHTHTGEEFTVILDGGYSDRGEHFGRGDVGVVDKSVDHAPVADPDGPCLCLIVSRGPVRLTGRVGRLLNPFIRG